MITGLYKQNRIVVEYFSTHLLLHWHTLAELSGVIIAVRQNYC